MTQDVGNKRHITDALESEHLRLVAQMAAIEWLVAVDFDWDDLAQVVQTTRSTVRAHFRHEEMQGFLAEVAAIRPAYFEHAVALEKEHRQFETDLDALAALIRKRQDRLTVRHKAGYWLERLRDHEAREIELVLEIRSRDLGDAD